MKKEGNKIMMRASTKFGLIVLFTGVIIGAAVTWALGPFGDARVHVLEGYTTYTNYDGTGISFSEKAGEQMGTGYDLAGSMWREHEGPWNFRLGYGSNSTCIKPLTTDQKLRLGVVSIAPKEAPGREIVVWLECLD